MIIYGNNSRFVFGDIESSKDLFLIMLFKQKLRILYFTFCVLFPTSKRSLYLYYLSWFNIHFTFLFAIEGISSKTEK